MEVLQKAIEILTQYSLCHRCLGRQFSNAGTGTTNYKRGKWLKNVLTMEFSNQSYNNDILKILAGSNTDIALSVLEKQHVEIPKNQECYICQDKLDLIQEIAYKIVQDLKGYEFDTYLIGTRLPKEWYEREKELKKQFAVIDTEYLNQEFNREIGKILGNETRKNVAFNNPDITVQINPLKKTIKINPRSVYLYGRYLKYVRTIPQTRWYCSNCNGKGCKECNFTGKRYQESVEELIMAVPITVFRGEDASLHGAGREDIDAKMLGTGRPFVLEIKNPSIRSCNLDNLQQLINKQAESKVEVKDLRWSSKEEVVHLKEHAPDTVKEYKAEIKFDNPISDNQIATIENYFQNIVLDQQTPTRVVHRRADKIRKKEVYSIKCKRISENSLIAYMKCDGGCYVKELISGDNGRTKPSISEKVKIPAVCTKLDVMLVQEEPLSEK